MLTSDFGDAPDTGAGTGTGNYQTLSSDNGPSHDITTTQTTLFLGAGVDGEADATPSRNANGDDITTLPDDEDGLTEPAQDLVLTVGSAPVVRVRATNTTGSNATLYGWIDFNRDGVFDNVTERASVAVPTATSNGTFALTFPVIPINTAAGATYSRFRLSTDAAAADGEVEDYTATITKRSSGIADSAKNLEISYATNGGLILSRYDSFGSSVASLGDLDGDGVTDRAVGANGDDMGGPGRGALYVQFMNSNGTVKSSVKLASGTNGGPTLADGDFFGSSVASLGDLDGDGVTDLAVGANGDDTGGSRRGAVHVLLLNANGTVKNSKKIASGTNGGPELAKYDRFGSSVASLGDLDGDGVTDLAVGANYDGTGGIRHGAVHVLLLNANGTVKSSKKIASGTNGGPELAKYDRFGSSVASLGDLDGDGVTDLAVGADGDDTNGSNRGAVHVLLLNTNGTVKSRLKIASGTNGGPTLANADFFGSSVASLGDLDGDGVVDLAVGADGDDTGGLVLGARGRVCVDDERERHGEEQREDCQQHQRWPHACERTPFRQFRGISG
ncbi:MAG: integrin alpha [Planctomycetia bacterium]|nr:integrin alpha [Planctomycetia bacterium]